jgi:hypothetical protein
MSTGKEQPQAERDEALTPEDEDELERRLEESLDAEREGRLVAWDALFPPQRLTG